MSFTQKNKPILSGNGLPEVYLNAYAFGSSFGSVAGTTALVTNFGRLLPNEPLVILPRFVLLSPFPIVILLFLLFIKLDFKINF